MHAEHSYDVIIAGVGAMGSAAAFHLAARGKRVLGLEQFSIGHGNGSSGGESRIIRSAYTEGSDYVKLAQRSFVLFRELEQRTGQHLLTMTGGLDIGPADGRLVEGTLKACRDNDLEYRQLTGAQVNREFPAFRLPTSFAAVSYPEAGVLRPEACIRAHVQAARHAGAVILDHTAITAIDRDQTITVRTDKGDVFQAPRLIVTAGAWAPALFPEFKPVLQPERQVVGWFDTDQPQLFTPDHFPIFILAEERPEAGQDTTIGWYGFPAIDGNPMKFARYGHLKQKVDAAALNPNITADDRAVFQKLQPYFTAALGEPKKLKTCKFTYSPDHHFILGFHPKHSNIYIASPCSGHGFKFSSVIGEIIADTLTTGSLKYNIALHDIKRLALG